MSVLLFPVWLSGHTSAYLFAVGYTVRHRVSKFELNIPFQHKYGYIRDDAIELALPY